MKKAWEIKLAGIIAVLAMLAGLAVPAGVLAAPRASIKAGHGAIGASLYSGVSEVDPELGNIPGFEIWGEYGLGNNLALRGSHLSLDLLADTPLDHWVEARFNESHLDLQLGLNDNLAVFGGLLIDSWWFENTRLHTENGGEAGLLFNVPLSLRAEFFGSLALARIRKESFTNLGFGLDFRVAPALFLGFAYKRVLDDWSGFGGGLTCRF